MHDAVELAAVLPPQPGNVYGDCAFTGVPAERLILGRGGQQRTVRTGIRGRSPDGLAQLEANNAVVQRVRCRMEKVFGTWKRGYGLRRRRWLGLAKADLQVQLCALAYNLPRSIALLHAAAA
jgi:IS5 family transposase